MPLQILVNQQLLTPFQHFGTAKKQLSPQNQKALPQQPTFSKKIVLEIGMKFVILPVISANGDLIQSSLKKVLELQLAFTEQALLLDKRGTLVRN